MISPQGLVLASHTVNLDLHVLTWRANRATPANIYGIEWERYGPSLNAA